MDCDKVWGNRERTENMENRGHTGSMKKVNIIMKKTYWFTVKVDDGFLEEFERVVSVCWVLLTKEVDVTKLRKGRILTNS